MLWPKKSSYKEKIPTARKFPYAPHPHNIRNIKYATTVGKRGLIGSECTVDSR